MEGLACKKGSGRPGFAIKCDIRSKHDAIMRISEIVLDEIQRDDLAIADTLQPTAAPSNHRPIGDHTRSRAPNSLIRNPSNDSTPRGQRSEFVADGHCKDKEVITIPLTCEVQDWKPLCKRKYLQGAIFAGNVNPSQDVSNLTTTKKPTKKPMSSGNIGKEDINKTEANTAVWDGTSPKDTSSVQKNFPPKTQKPSSHEQPTPLSDEMSMCDFVGDFSAEHPTVQGVIRSDHPPIMVDEMIESNQDNTTLSVEDPLTLLEMVSDVPKDIMSICWRYQQLDDQQLENIRHYMIAKAFGWRGNVLEESTG